MICSTCVNYLTCAKCRSSGGGFLSICARGMTQRERAIQRPTHQPIHSPFDKSTHVSSINQNETIHNTNATYTCGGSQESRRRFTLPRCVRVFMWQHDWRGAPFMRRSSDPHAAAKKWEMPGRRKFRRRIVVIVNQFEFSAQLRGGHCHTIRCIITAC